MRGDSGTSESRAMLSHLEDVIQSHVAIGEGLNVAPEHNHHLLEPILKKPLHGDGLGCVQLNVEVDEKIRRRHVLHTNPASIEQGLKLDGRAGSPTPRGRDRRRQGSGCRPGRARTCGERVGTWAVLVQLRKKPRPVTKIGASHFGRTTPLVLACGVRTECRASTQTACEHPL